MELFYYYNFPFFKFITIYNELFDKNKYIRTFFKRAENLNKLKTKY